MECSSMRRERPGRPYLRVPAGRGGSGDRDGRRRRSDRSNRFEELEGCVSTGADSWHVVGRKEWPTIAAILSTRFASYGRTRRRERIQVREKGQFQQ